MQGEWRFERQGFEEYRYGIVAGSVSLPPSPASRRLPLPASLPATLSLEVRSCAWESGQRKMGMEMEMTLG